MTRTPRSLLTAVHILAVTVAGGPSLVSAPGFVASRSHPTNEKTAFGLRQ